MERRNHRRGIDGVLPGQRGLRPDQRLAWGPLRCPQHDDLRRRSLRREHAVVGRHHSALALLCHIRGHAVPDAIHLDGAFDGSGESVVQTKPGIGRGNSMGRRRSRDRDHGTFDQLSHRVVGLAGHFLEHRTGGRWHRACTVAVFPKQAF